MAVKRRRKGEGGVYQRHDGTWAAIVELGRSELGKRQRYYIYGRNAAEVSRKLREAMRDIERGLTPIKKHGKTLGMFLDQWHADVVKLRNRPTTIEDYETTIRLHIKPFIGSVPLSQLSTTTIQALYGELLRKKRGPRTRQKVHVLLQQALTHAVKLDEIRINPVSMASAPSYKSQTMHPLTLAQVHKLLKSSEGHWMHSAITLSAFLGLRRGEVFGLQWGDVDFDRGLLSISRSLGKEEIGETKTASSRRTIAMPTTVMTALLDQRKRLEKTKLGIESKSLVFPGLRGQPYKTNNVGRVFRKLLTKAELPQVRWHDLRHTAATSLLAIGTNPKIVMELLGHSNISTTLGIYSHVLPHLQGETMDKLETAFAVIGSKIGSTEADSETEPDDGPEETL